MEDVIGSTPLVRLQRLPGPENERRGNVLLAKLAAISSDEYMAARDITLNTYKSQVRTLLRKLGADSLEAARRIVFTGDGRAVRARA